MSKIILSKRDKTLYGLLGLSVLIMIFGILFLVNAMGIADFYPHYAAIENALAKYIVVILTMSCGIMLFSNVALRFEGDKLRKGLTIGITAFAFILTLPLVYVFFSLLPFAASHNAADIQAAIQGVALADQPAVLGLNAVDGIMGVHTIYLGFADWFGEGGFLWVVLVFMMILGLVFLLEPLMAGICVVKGKLLQLFGKDANGKFKVVAVVELPVLKARRLAAEAEVVEATTAPEDEEEAA